MKKIISILFILIFVATGISYSQTFKIIVNKGNDVSSLSKKEASDFFLKKKSKWSNGTGVVPVDQSSGSNVREAFSQQVHGKSVSAIRSFWQQAAFSGTATAPSEKASDEEVIEFVKKNPGGIGYISSTNKTSDVKTITIN